MDTAENRKHVLILSGGRIDPEFARDYLKDKHYDLIISADSGIDFCRQAELMPDVILGDFDSASPQAMAFYKGECPERIETFPARKDWTDTELAVRKALEAGAGQITVLGATGTRLDHVLGNIQLLKQALDAGAECVLVDAHNRIRMTDRSLILQKKEQFGTYVSLIPFTPQVTGLTLRGFSYDVDQAVLESGRTLGISNEICREEAKIDLESGILLVMESRD